MMSSRAKSLTSLEWKVSEIGAVQWCKRSLARTCGLKEDCAISHLFFGFLGFEGLRFEQDELGSAPTCEGLVSAT